MLVLFFVAGIAGVAAVADYCRVVKMDGNWTLIDESGRPFFARAIGHAPKTEAARAMLRSWNFDGRRVPFIGFDDVCYRPDPDLYIRKATGGPMTAFPNVFHPEFQKNCERRAAQVCTKEFGDGRVIGYFLDNELAWWGRGGLSLDTGLFDAVRELPEAHSARQALERFVEGRPVTDGIKRDFLRLAAEKYFRATTSAVRGCDPNRLVMGCRFAGMNGADDIVYEVAGRYCDVVSVNLYPTAELASGEICIERGRQTVEEWFAHLSEVSGRPLYISEWSFPALDTGRRCRLGAGQRVPTQVERTRCCELFLGKLLASPYVVGYDFFTWMDQPVEGQAAANPEDCNYGVVREDGTPYELLTAMFTRLNGAARVRREEKKACRHESEAEAFFKMAVENPHPVRAARAGARWSLANTCGVSLCGSLGASVEAAWIQFKSENVGSFFGMVETDMPVDWHRQAEVVDVRLKEGTGFASAELTLRTSPGEVAFEIVERVSLAGSGNAFLCEVVSVKNIGRKRIDLAGIYTAIAPDDGRGAYEGREIQGGDWSAARVAEWRYADGLALRVQSRDEALSHMKLWKDENRYPHKDVAFSPKYRTYLKPGETFVPVRPMASRVECLTSPSRGHCVRPK